MKLMKGKRSVTLIMFFTQPWLTTSTYLEIIVYINALGPLGRVVHTCSHDYLEQFYWLLYKLV